LEDYDMTTKKKELIASIALQMVSRDSYLMAQRDLTGAVLHVGKEAFAAFVFQQLAAFAGSWFLNRPVEAAGMTLVGIPDCLSQLIYDSLPRDPVEAAKVCRRWQLTRVEGLPVPEGYSDVGKN
jgi:hypothetical protein